jgi:hypothetical protein
MSRYWTAAQLTELDYDILRDLASARRQNQNGGWMIPLDLGGGNGSPHSYRLRRMVKAGWVETRQRFSGDAADIDPPPGARGSRIYRLTEAGQAELATRVAARQTARAAEEETRDAR